MMENQEHLMTESDGLVLSMKSKIRLITIFLCLQDWVSGGGIIKIQCREKRAGLAEG